MNRAGRRLAGKRKKAISRELVRMEKPEQYQQGFMDGGNEMVRAAYAAFCASMKTCGFSTKDILAVLKDMDDILYMYSGDEEMIKSAFDNAGIIMDLDEVFPDDRFTEVT